MNEVRPHTVAGMHVQTTALQLVSQRTVDDQLLGDICGGTHINIVDRPGVLSSLNSHEAEQMIARSDTALRQRRVVAMASRRGLPPCQDLITSGASPDAFAVGNDCFALGLYRALAERKITIPNDARIVGFGDYPFAG
jgi:hypothetical protein